MALKMFRSTRSLEKLEKEAHKNIDKYRNGDFCDFLDFQNYEILDENFDEDAFDGLKNGKGPEHDLYNAKYTWQKLQNITPRIARQQRFWTVLTHGPCLDYTRSRWPFINDNNKDVKNVRQHFLAKGNRGIERDNAISRLWMTSYIVSKVTSKYLSQDEGLSVLLNTTDFRESVIGRPTVMQSVKTLTAVMETAKRILIDDNNPDFFKRHEGAGPYKNWLSKINLEGGVTLLDAMDTKDLKKLVDRCADEAQKN